MAESSTSVEAMAKAADDGPAILTFGDLEVLRERLVAAVSALAPQLVVGPVADRVASRLTRMPVQ